MWMPLSKYAKISTIAGLTALTLSIHYGWAFEAIFGHMHWFHALHGRFCYIPIVVAASWFGLRGGLVVAATISAFVLPYIVRASLETHELAGELVEIVFYFLMAGLVNWWKENGEGDVCILAHTNNYGSPEAEQDETEEWADIVAGALIELGVPAD